MEQKHLTKWQTEFEVFAAKISQYAYRREVKVHLGQYVRALLETETPRNCWNLAEQSGQRGPQKLQRLLSQSQWSEEGLKSALQSESYELFRGEEHVWLLDESGIAKAGKDSVGVQRQYSGTLGKVGNCQVAVFLGLATLSKYTLLDFALYLPKKWFQDKERLEMAQVPENIKFKTKPKQAIGLLENQLKAGFRAAWTTGDSVYGNSPELRTFLASEQLAYVLGVSRTLKVKVCFSQMEKYAPGKWQNVMRREELSLSEIGKRLSQKRWHRFRFRGTQGLSRYKWAMIGITLKSQQLTLLVRRLNQDLSFFLCSCDKPRLRKLAQVAHLRWSIERCFAETKQEVGLDEYQVRLWKSWHRHMTLCLAAFHFLVKVKFALEVYSVSQVRYLLQMPSKARGQALELSLFWFEWRHKHKLKVLNWFLKPKKLKPNGHELLRLKE